MTIDVLKEAIRRREPKQQRSKKTVERILHASMQLMAEDTDQQKISTHLIAKKAGVAVGSVYQFFHNIESIRLALLEQLFGQLNSCYERLIYELPNDCGFTELIEHLIDATVDFQRTHPESVKTLVANRHTSEYFSVVERMHHANWSMFVSIYGAKNKVISDHELQRRSITVLSLGKMMTMLVWTAESEPDRNNHIREWKSLLGFYIQDIPDELRITETS